MDENNRSVTLTSEDERLLVKYADVIIAEEGAEVPAAAEVLAQIICTTPPELVENIYKLQPTKRLIVVTRTTMAADLARVLSGSITSNHFALYGNGTWYADAALAEIRRISSMLTDEEGNELQLSNQLIPGIYASEDGRLLAEKGYLAELGGTTLYGKQFHDAWGTLLPKRFTMSTLAGDNISFTTRTLAAANLLAQMKKRDDGMIPVPEHTLVFEKGRCLVTEWTQPEDRDAGLRRVFFLQLFGAEERGDALASMLPVLAEADEIPDSFLADLERIYINNAPCSFRKWSNIIDRLLLDYEELGIVKGGASE
ncbi:MAG: hypothetical protein K6F80_02545 [Oscillospiraceae bacterium]|nr:hypothetical protein [Oscillospiraceae bacterium]